MEDRATLRISSQHIANWLLPRRVTEAQVDATLQRMAAVVDEQNAGRSRTTAPMAPGLRRVAWPSRRPCDLVFEGWQQPSGYTEPLLHAFRQKVKAGT